MLHREKVNHAKETSLREAIEKSAAAIDRDLAGRGPADAARIHV
jgi:hypothetical protein